MSLRPGAMRLRMARPRAVRERTAMKLFYGWVIVDRNIAVRDELLPPTQDRPAHRLGGARQPSVGAVGLVPGMGCGNAIGCPVQDDRPAWPAALRQKHEGVEPGAVAHRHHDLKTAGVGHLQTTIRCGSGALQSASSRSAARKENELISFDLTRLGRWSRRLRQPERCERR
jgi:hypothetical protein